MRKIHAGIYDDSGEESDPNVPSDKEENSDDELIPPDNKNDDDPEDSDPDDDPQDDKDSDDDDEAEDTDDGSTYSPAALAKAASYAEKRISLLSTPLSVILSGKTNFFEFLFCLEERAQTADWGHICDFPMPDETTKNLLHDFASLPAKQIKDLAKARWIAQDRATTNRLANDQSTDQFASRVLQELLRVSVSTDIRQTVSYDIPRSLARDGPFYFWMIYNHLFPSNMLYRATVIQQMQSLTLANDCDGDIDRYMQRMRQFQRLIGTIESQTMWDLVSRALKQFQTAKSTAFKDQMVKYEVEWLRGSKTWTLETIFEEARTLATTYRLQQTWDKPSSQETEIMVLKAEIEKQRDWNKQLNQAIQSSKSALLSTLQQSSGSSNGKKSSNTTPSKPKYPRPTWYYKKPDDLTEKKSFGGRDTWQYCVTCEHWSCAHNSESHDDYMTRMRGRKRKQERNNNGGQNGKSGKNGKDGNKKVQAMVAECDKLQKATANFSLARAIDSFNGGEEARG